ncbi:YbhB/YbcL family Raf kinase inhibitor-like protein [Candidatus Dojkabacteria bacterium]|jgi:hypothetical protein|nr:YbhB/YbcL family Raf kinase inhibitor-like protein [Candidatus Dojkabacteria bacterium]
MLLNSPTLTHNGTIPVKYTADGENITPPFTISYVPQAAQSLVFLVEDPDAPVGLWVHWMIWNINPNITEMKENEIPRDGIVGMNSSMQNEWDKISPPDKEHRYFFKLYALDIKLELDPATTKSEDLVAAMEGHTVAKAEFIGKYGVKEEEPIAAS